jgi:hypothetical protein
MQSFSLHAEPAAEAAAAAAAAPSQGEVRRGTRQRQEPIRLQSEQEGEALSRAEEADIQAALLLSLQAEDDSGEEVEIAAAESDEEAEEEAEEGKKEEIKEADPHDWHAPTPGRLFAPFPLPLHDAAGQPRRLHGVGVPGHPPTRLQLLQLFLTHDLLRSWVGLTNTAAPVGWSTTDVEELLCFIGVHLFMGIDSLPQRRMYWEAETRHDTIANMLSRDRFEQINRYFTVSEPQPVATPRNPFSSVRDFIAALNHSFPQHWTPGRHLALDESMVSFRGRSDIKQFVPGKPHPHGYKIWVLANENYVLQFQLYQGKAAAGPSIHDMVLQLTSLYQHTHHVLYTDTLFSSPTLAHSLLQVGIRVCGTVKRNRLGMPSKEQLPVAVTEALHGGGAVQMQKGEENVLTLCAWKDKRLILLLYNHIDPRLFTSLKRWNDAGVQYDLPCPQAIRDYFQYARAVDVINQLHYSYLVGRKSRKCSTRLVWWLLDICILNAYRLWQCDHPEESHLTFRMALMHELMEQLPAERRPQRAMRAWEGGAALATEHYSTHSPDKRDCRVCSDRARERKQTHLICTKCAVHLCCEDCWKTYHSNL